MDNNHAVFSQINHRFVQQFILLNIVTNKWTTSLLFDLISKEYI